MKNWGARPGETRRSLPGDSLVPNPQAHTTRAVSIDAPAQDVWPWLVQMGQARGGFYSYDLLERLAGLRIRNANMIHQQWQDLDVGDVVRLSPSSAMVVADVEPEEALVLYQDVPLTAEYDEPFRWSWAFYLEPIGTARTRLLVRTRVAWKPDGLARYIMDGPVELIHFMMERGMLLGVKKRAEGMG